MISINIAWSPLLEQDDLVFGIQRMTWFDPNNCLHIIVFMFPEMKCHCTQHPSFFTWGPGGKYEALCFS
jgi:hypothetical protein